MQGLQCPLNLAIVSGSWSLDLNDSASRKAILTIFQNGDTVYGTGNLNLDANTAMTAAASGTVTGDQLNLRSRIVRKSKTLSHFHLAS
jgi:hypothetical protein